jgi:transportin-1
LALRYISGSEEKTQAFKGLCAMIPYNPIGIAENFPYFCEALIEFKNPS